MNTNTNTIVIRHNLDASIPCINVTCRDNDNSHGGEGYLMPFRAYRFQVCGTADGMGDFGSSDVRQMKEVLQWMPEYQQIEYLREQAVIALMRWQSAYKYGISMTADEEEIFEDFLKECRDWVMSR